MKLLYSPDVRNLASLYLLEQDYDLNKYSIESVIEAELKKSDAILRCIIFTIEIDEPLPIGNYIKTSNNKYYQTMTLATAINYSLSHPDNKHLRNLILDNFPNVLTKQLGFRKKILIQDSSEFLSKDKSCSIYFLDNLESMIRFINLNCNNEHLKYITPMTIRLYIPKDYFLLSLGDIKPETIIYKKPLILNGHLVYETLNGITDKRINDKLMNDSKLYYEYGDESFLSGFTVYSVILSMTISEWKTLIDKLSPYERNMSHQVISSIISFLQPYRNLVNLFM